MEGSVLPSARRDWVGDARDAVSRKAKCCARQVKPRMVRINGQRGGRSGYDGLLEDEATASLPGESAARGRSEGWCWLWLHGGPASARLGMRAGGLDPRVWVVLGRMRLGWWSWRSRHTISVGGGLTVGKQPKDAIQHDMGVGDADCAVTSRTSEGLMPREPNRKRARHGRSGCCGRHTSSAARRGGVQRVAGVSAGCGGMRLLGC
ncbi:hypothetical protein F5X68DRAFT_199493 [Plectosphaerella plurivora]|uniref:Uncharacterized protein n=1 Tax=Plectosphaerella plurivora TaxID=936078 RepID=A0A9P8VHN8_9PEZI|nr:hypothetical protein F5X68DRAFT_199493 [Plectosphaerella plurivora]